MKEQRSYYYNLLGDLALTLNDAFEEILSKMECEFDGMCRERDEFIASFVDYESKLEILNANIDRVREDIKRVREFMAVDSTGGAE